MSQNRNIVHRKSPPHEAVCYPHYLTKQGCPSSNPSSVRSSLPMSRPLDAIPPILQETLQATLQALRSHRWSQSLLQLPGLPAKCRPLASLDGSRWVVSPLQVPTILSAGLMFDAAISDMQPVANILILHGQRKTPSAL